MKILCLPLILLGSALAQTNPNCPGATGTQPHCTILNWTPPASGGTPTSYNAYRSNATGVCTWAQSTSGPITSPAGCVKIGSATVPATTLVDNSSTTNILTEGVTYFYVVTSANATGESAPSNEASAKIPVSPPASPTSLIGVPH